MPQQKPADTLSLVRIVDGKCDLGLPRCGNDVAAPAHNDFAARLIQLRDERDVVDKVDVEKECELLFGEVFLRPEETAVNRLRGRAPERCCDRVAIGGPLSADLHAAAVPQHLHRRIRAGFHWSRHEVHAAVHAMPTSGAVLLSNTGGPAGMLGALTARRADGIQACTPAPKAGTAP